MNWVGILYVNNNCYYMNGRLIATSEKQFHNHCCFCKMPRWIMGFFSGSNISNMLVIQDACFIEYRSWKRFVYVHVKKERYVVSLMIGLMVTSFFWVLIFANFKFSIRNDPTLPSYQFVSVWVRNFCGNQPCISELGIYPNLLLIRHHKTSDPPGCNRIQKGVVKCFIESSSMGG